MPSKNQMELMKLFKENVKTDITHTSDIIDLIQKKLQDFDLNLNSLKSSTSELNKDFAVIEEKITSLDTSFRRVNSYSSLSRSESTSSIASSYTSSSSSDFLSENEAESDRDELESTFVIVTKDEKTNDIMVDENERSVGRIGESETVIEQLRKQEYQMIDQNCNQLIELLIKNATTATM